MKSRDTKAAFWYTIGNFAVKGFAFLTLPIFTRLLSVSDFGKVSIYSTWLAIFSILIALDLNAAVVRGKYDFGEKYRSYLSSVLFLSSIIFVLWLAVFLALNEKLSKALGLPFFLLVILLINSYSQFVIRFKLAEFTSNRDYKKYITVSLVNVILNFTLSLLFIFLISEKYIGRIFGMFLSSIIIAISLYISVLKNGREYVNKEYWSYALKLSIPLIIHNLSGIILAQFDRIMINKYYSSVETGIYSFAYTIGMIINVIWGALNLAWIPWFFENMKNENYENIRKKTLAYISFFSSITVLLVFVSPEIVKIAAPSGYLPGLGLVPIISASYYFVFLYSLPANLEFYLKKTHIISLGTILAGAINVFLNYIFIPTFGYSAAAFTTLVSYIFLFAFHYFNARILFKKNLFPLRYFLYGMLIIFGSIIAFYVFISNPFIRYSIILISTLTTLRFLKKNVLD